MFAGELFEIGKVGVRALGDHPRLIRPVVSEKGSSIHSSKHSITLRRVNSNSLLDAVRTALSNRGVDNKTVRRLNLEVLVEEFETLARLAKLHDLDESVLSQVRNQHRNIGDRLARKIEANMTKPPGWMDVPHFKSADSAVDYAELMHIYESLPEKEREAWMTMGRSLTEKGPRGPNNPFGTVPKPKGPKSGTQ